MQINFSKLKSDYEKISFNLKKAKENMSDQVFRNKIEVKKTKINLRKAKKDLDDTILRSEFNGLISNVNISLGQFVSNSHKVADIKSTENKESSKKRENLLKIKNLAKNMKFY